MNTDQFNQLPKSIQKCWEWDDEAKEYFQCEGMTQEQLQVVVSILNKV